MQTLILKSDNKEALEAIRALADVLDIDSCFSADQEDRDNYIEKGVRIVKPKKVFDPKKLAGTLTDLNLEDPSEIRKKAWKRKKANY